MRRSGVSYHAAILFVLLLLTGCSPVRIIGIELLNPPPVMVDDTLQSLTLLNQSMDERFLNWKNDSLEKLLISRKMELDTVLLDSLASDTMLQVAAEKMFESGRFEVVIPFERDINSREWDTEMPWERVSSICTEFNTDGIAVLESFSQSLNTEFYSTYEYISPNITKPAYYGAVDLAYRTSWRIYNPQKEHTREILVSDTIYWDSYAYAIEEMYLQLPTIKEILVTGGIVAAESMTERICPQWVGAQRKLLNTGNKEIDKAMTLAMNGSWQEAHDLWENYTNVKGKERRSRIEFNLAVASEMLGELEKAIEWGIMSFHSNYKKRTEDYLRELGKRRAILNRVR